MFAARVAQSRARLVTARQYTRDDDGRFAHNPGSGGAGGEGDMPAAGAGMQDETQIRAAFEYHDQHTGMSAHVSEIRPGANGLKYVDIEIRNAAGKHVGSSVRTISADGKTVYHSGLGINPNLGGIQGQGFATRFNTQAEAVYRANGVEQINLTAAHVGSYAWARAGYDFRSDSTRQEMAGTFFRAANSGRYTDDQIAHMAKVWKNPQATPLEFAMTGWTPGATTWPGKEIIMTTMWEGVKKL